MQKSIGKIIEDFLKNKSEKIKSFVLEYIDYFLIKLGHEPTIDDSIIILYSLKIFSKLDLVDKDIYLVDDDDFETFEYNETMSGDVENNIMKYDNMIIDTISNDINNKLKNKTKIGIKNIIHNMVAAKYIDETKLIFSTQIKID